METFLRTNETCLLDRGRSIRVVEDPPREGRHEGIGSQNAPRINRVEKNLELVRSQNSPDKSCSIWEPVDPQRTIGRMRALQTEYDLGPHRA